MSRQDYIKFCNSEDVPLFLQPWWLDSTCGRDNWDAITIKRGQEVVAIMPIFIEKKYIFKYITQPILTQFMGVYIKYPKNQKYEKRLHYQKEIIYEIIDRLPKFDYFNIYFDSSFTNWLPFMWKGFKQTTHYTYVIEDNNLDSIYNNFSKRVRKEINRALKNGVEIIDSDNIEAFYEINKITFKKQNIEIPYSFEYVKNLYETAKENSAAIMKFAIKDGKILSVLLAFNDSKRVYSILGSSNRDLELYGSEYLLDWHMIQAAIKRGLVYDFEGSVIERIEQRVRSFGAIQKPIFRIFKTNSTILKLKNCIKELRDVADIY